MDDIEIMRRVLDLASKGKGRTLTNPMVGAVVVKEGRIIGEGYHHSYGDIHAEIDAFNNLTESAEGASLYVNLEPCSHEGKQPPCVDEVIRRGIKEVYIANIDTNPKVDGLSKLIEAGIKVRTGILEKEAAKLNESFFFNIKHQRPLVALKYAMTMDGKIATATGDSKWISGDDSRHFVHQIRSKYDAIVVGKGTAMADNPSLNARIENGVDPVRIIVDSKLDIDPNLKVFDLESDKKTYIATTSDKDFEQAELIRCKLKNGQVDLEDLLEQLYQMNIGSVLVEGGARLNNSFLEAGLVDKVYAFIAPKIISGEKSLSPFLGPGKESMADAYKFEIVDVKRFEDDLMIEADNVYRHS